MSGDTDRISCVHEESMSGFLDQCLATDEHRRLQEHVDQCQQCAAVLDELRAADASLRQGLSDLDEWTRPATERLAGRLAQVMAADQGPVIPPGSSVGPVVLVDSLPARPLVRPSPLGLAGTALAVGVAAGVLVGGFLEVRWRGPGASSVETGFVSGPMPTDGLIADFVHSGGDHFEVSALDSADILLGKLANLDEDSDPRRFQQLRTHVLEAGLLLAIGEERRHARDPELLSYLSRLEILLARLINARSMVEARSELSRTAQVLRASNLLDDARLIRVRRRSASTEGGRSDPTSSHETEGY